MKYLAETDSELFDILEREANREESTIELIASENFTSQAVMEMVGGVMTNKYAEGYPGRRYYGGCEVVDEAGLGDGISSAVLDTTAYSIASIRTFVPQEANWFDNFRASSALQPRYMR